MNGIQYVMNEKGKKTAVLIDLDRYGDVWEDFWDVAMAERRKNDPRESLDSVKRRIASRGKH